MGYSEIYCHLCGVTFNIARSRKVGEPDLAAWDYAGSREDALELAELDDLEQCVQNGCVVAVKYQKANIDDPVNDPDYVIEDDSDEEPYEYDSDHDSTDAMSVDEDEGSTTTTTDAYQDFLSSTLYPQNELYGEPIGNFGYSNTNTCARNETIINIAEEEIPAEYGPEELEHIPSLTCTEANAYSGQRIALEEMRGCRTVQFLVHKSCAEGKWKPDGLHEPWEKSEDWFLGGVCDGLSRDGYPDVWPARGGVETPATDNMNFVPESTTADEFAMPFHPWCFDIFCRQSKVQFKHVNISGLMKWRNAEFTWDDFHSFPRAGDISSMEEQFWRHDLGSEYLAANPLYVPYLPSVLDAAREDNVDKYAEVTKTREQGGRANLESLPLDIHLLIIEFLDPADITSLRIASAAFTKLPNSVWYRLLRDEMPWLWEAWGEGEIEHTPSPWTMMTANEVKLLLEQRKHYSKILAKERIPVKGMLDYLLPNPSARPDVKLSRGNTNWHQVYVQIKQNWDRLKGLRNRQRIWEDMEEVMRRIKTYEQE